MLFDCQVNSFDFGGRVAVKMIVREDYIAFGLCSLQSGPSDRKNSYCC